MIIGAVLCDSALENKIYDDGFKYGENERLKVKNWSGRDTRRGTTKRKCAKKEIFHGCQPTV